MSVEGIDKIVQRELAARRTGNLHFAGFSLAVLIVVVALVSTM